MLKRAEFAKACDGVMDVASALQLVEIAIGDLEDRTPSDVVACEHLGDLRRTLRLSRNRLDDVTEYLDRIESGRFGDLFA